MRFDVVQRTARHVRVGAVVMHHQMYAFLRQRQRDLPADAVRGAGDERYVVSEFKLHRNAPTDTLSSPYYT